MYLPSNVKGYTIQSLAVVVGNLLNLNFGLTFGITPAHIELYQSEIYTPLNRAITSKESSWVAGSLFLSAAFGSLILGLASSKIGPKSVMLLSGLLQITSWFCLLFAYEIVHIYWSRIFAGIAAGATITVMPIYISAIGQTIKSRAALTASVDCWRAFGITIGFVLGSYLRYEYVSVVGILISIGFSMIFPFVQESPHYFLQKGNMANLEKSLRWFRGIRSFEGRNNPEFELELKQIKNGVNGKEQLVVLPSHLLRIFSVELSFTVGAQLSGIYIILHYGSQIVEYSSAPLNIPSDVSIMILTALHLLGTILAKYVSGSIYRRVLLLVTSIISGVCLISATICLTYGKQWKVDDDLKPWIMLLLLSVHILFASFGYFSFSTTILEENIPKKIQCILLSLVHHLTWIIAFVLIQFYVPIVNGTSVSALLLIFAFGCVSITVSSLFLFTKTQPAKEIDLKIQGESMRNVYLTNLHI